METKKVATADVYSGRYPLGSLAQKIFEPLATAKKDENGTLVV